MVRLRQHGAWLVTLTLWVCVLSSVLPGQVTAMDYDSIAFECLIAAADTIVLGRAERHPSGAYQVEVTEVVAGERLTGPLQFEVSPWQGPATQPSGTALLFLRRPAGKPNFEVVGPSAEGWLPVQDERVRLAGIAMRDGPGPAVPRDAPQLALAPLVDALRALDACVKWSRDPEHARVRATLVCDEDRLKAVRQQSTVSAYLVTAAVRASAGEGIPCLAVAAPRPR